MVSGVLALVLLLLRPDAISAPGDPYCFAQASRQYAVDTDVLVAIAWRESHFAPWKTHHNTDGTVDYGLMQINSRNLPGLQLTPQSAQAPCPNILGAARLYREQIRRFGNTWDAVGAYHSTTPALQRRYAQEIWMTYTIVRSVRQAVRDWRALLNAGDVIILGDVIAYPWAGKVSPGTASDHAARITEPFLR